MVNDANTNLCVQNTNLCVQNTNLCVQNTNLCVQNTNLCVQNTNLCVENANLRVENANLCVENEILNFGGNCPPYYTPCCLSPLYFEFFLFKSVFHPASHCIWRVIWRVYILFCYSGYLYSDVRTTGAAGASAHPMPFVFITFWVQCGCKL